MNLRSLPHDPSRTPGARRRTVAATGLLLTTALAAGLGACGSSDDGATGTTTTSAHTTAASAAACTAFTEMSALTFQMPEDPAETATFLRDQMVPTVSTVVAGLPHSASGAGQTVLDAYTAAAATGTPDAVMSPEVMAAQAQVGKALFDGCDANRLEVTGIDYAFQGLPTELPAGPTSIAFTDGGNEEHEIMIVKAADGDAITLDELLALPGDEAFARVQPVTVTWGAPGETGYTSVDLAPGTYFALCNIPIGGGPDGAPHHTAGMKQTFVVR
jgi:hypothetical protein